MLTLLLKCARLHMLMAWFSTLGGAHSQLGDSLYEHVSTPPPPPPPTRLLILTSLSPLLQYTGNTSRGFIIKAIRISY